MYSLAKEARAAVVYLSFVCWPAKLHKDLSMDSIINSFGASVAFYHKYCTCNTVFYGENNCNLDNFRGVKQYFPLKYKLVEGRSRKVFLNM